jgi:hypothetical protein
LLSIPYKPDNACSTDRILPRCIGQAHAPQAVANKGIVVNFQRRTTDRQTVQFAPTHPGLDAFIGNAPLQLRNRAERRHNHPPG